MQHNDELWWSAVKGKLRASLACLCFEALQCLFCPACRAPCSRGSRHCTVLSLCTLFLMMCSIELVVLYCCFTLFFVHCGGVVCGLVLVVFHFLQRGLCSSRGVLERLTQKMT
ncbi:hypothetical protein MTO96_041391 [Rhipicephalus appendiculatus]